MPRWHGDEAWHPGSFLRGRGRPTALEEEEKELLRALSDRVSCMGHAPHSVLQLAVRTGEAGRARSRGGVSEERVGAGRSESDLRRKQGMEIEEAKRTKMGGKES